MKYDVFISYSSQDQKIVEEICCFLEERGIKCFVAYRDIPPGVVWATAIVEGLEESQLMVVVFSENFNLSKEVDREIEMAAEDNKPIVTFRLDETKFKGAKRYYLKNLNWIEAFPNPQKALDKLYITVCKLLGKEVVATSSSNSNPVQADVSSPEEVDSSDNIQALSSSQITSTGQSTQANTLESQLTFDPSIGEFRQNSNCEGDSKSNLKGNFINGHEYVDLGLPSGVKWATCNVGASKPEEYGDYFAWGEINPKSDYSPENSESYDKDIHWLRRTEFIGRNGNLTLPHDAARQNWGGLWRIPTLKEIEELEYYTTSEWISQDGVKGRLMKSTRNGNSIFIPFSGYRVGRKVSGVGRDGNYWSSTPDEDDEEYAWMLSFFDKESEPDCSYRYFGRPIRPVSE